MRLIKVLVVPDRREGVEEILSLEAVKASKQCGRIGFTDRRHQNWLISSEKGLSIGKIATDVLAPSYDICPELDHLK
jgi:hypothetical protein